MDRILKQLQSINAEYKIAYSYALKIDELQQKIEVLLKDKKGDVKGYEGAIKKLNDNTIKGIKAKKLIKDIKTMQQKSIISHYESKKQIENTTKEQD